MIKYTKMTPSLRESVKEEQRALKQAHSEAITAYNKALMDYEEWQNLEDYQKLPENEPIIPDHPVEPEMESKEEDFEYEETAARIYQESDLIRAEAYEGKTLLEFSDGRNYFAKEDLEFFDKFLVKSDLNS